MACRGEGSLVSQRRRISRLSAEKGLSSLNDQARPRRHALAAREAAGARALAHALAAVTAAHAELGDDDHEFDDGAAAAAGASGGEPRMSARTRDQKALRDHAEVTQRCPARAITLCSVSAT